VNRLTSIVKDFLAGAGRANLFLAIIVSALPAALLRPRLILRVSHISERSIIPILLRRSFSATGTLQLGHGSPEMSGRSRSVL